MMTENRENKDKVANVKILVTGYTTADTKNSEEEKTCPTIALVRDGSLNIIIDPGVLDSQEILVDRLQAEGLSVNDINLVFITHSHLDHYRNIGLFINAKTLEFWGLWEGGKCEDWPEQFTRNIKIIKTPGHSADSLTMLVKTKEGTVAICGDVFWKENYPPQDPYASDPAKLPASRKKVLAAANLIIPGHGQMFRV
jgi:glyoxylase-like metal-dependent hydrolase (beta-lactamase superfamily II)